ncbi:MAG: CidA/LrgA family protein [Propionibacteriales bacterium]|nr:CidA/LrgA family protein [Propionibacteriales bacterium]
MSNAPVLKGLLVLLTCQLAGEVAVRFTGVEFPGPVVGMLLFLVLLRTRKPADSSALVAAPSLLLRHLHLLFIPAGVGIVVYLGRIADDAWPLALGLWGSWLIGFVVTALVASGLLRTVKDHA